MATKQSILVIDDDVDTRELLKDALESCGLQVFTGPDGDHATRLLQARTFDLLVTDLVMPGKEGLETIAEVRRTHPEMKILVVSGFDHYFKTAKLSGATETMSKPVTTEALCRKVLELLERQTG